MFTKFCFYLNIRIVFTFTILVGILGFISTQAVSAATPLPGGQPDPVLNAIIVPTVATSVPQAGDLLPIGISTISVQFSTDMLADGTAFAVNKASNYLLVEAGTDGKFQTSSCAAKLAGDDVQIAINSVIYSSATFTSTLSINGGALLNSGNYQLLICGSTRINDLNGNKLNDGTDAVVRFLVIKDSGFDPYVNYGGGAGQAVGIGDFNHDGLTDVAMSTDSQVLIYLKNANGTLNTPATYTAGSRSEALVTGDLNSDGLTDVVTADFSSNTISVFLQQANGTLASRVTYTTSTGPDAIAVGDVTGDGLADVVISHWNAPYIGVFVQNPNGTLNTMTQYSAQQAGWDDIAIGDINNDGRNDVVKMVGQATANPKIYVYLQNQDGTLASAVSYIVGTSGAGNGIAIGDVTGDGLSDVVMSYGGNRPSSKMAVFAQGADGLLQTPISYDAYDIPEPVEVADVNLDGKLDVLTLHGGWGAMGVFLQKDGRLSPYTLYPVLDINGYRPQSLAVGDINQDGAVDAAVADVNYGLIILYHHAVPIPQVIMGGNVSPLDGEELNTGINQLSVQFNQQMKSDGSAGAASSVNNYLLVEDGADNTFQTSSCAGGVAGDDTVVSIDNVAYNDIKYFSQLSINGGVGLSQGRYRLFVCGTTSIQNLIGTKLNGGQSDGIITFTVWPAPHKISGNAGIAGVALSYTDGNSKIAIADGSGDYFFNVSDNWTGTVTPSKIGYTFTPASKDYTSVSNDIPNENYTANPITFTISGNVGVGGAVLGYTDGNFKTVTADNNGNYFLTVSYGWTGTITPSKPSYLFTPPYRNYSNVLADKLGENYTATLYYTISGNAGLPGANLNYFDGVSKSVIADSNGNYSFIVPVGWSGTVTPSKAGYTFYPTSYTYNTISADQTNQNYIASPILSSISGNVGIADVTMSYFDGVAKTVTSDVNGNYSLLVTFNWTGTVTPSKSGFIFTPTSRSYSNVQIDQPGQDFTPQALLTISGNAGVGGAIITYNDGSFKAVAADGNGNYSLQVPPNWSGTITPSKANYRFAPSNISFSNLQSDQSNQNFTAQHLYSITGNVSLSGATISYVDETLKTVTSSGGGAYSFQVPDGWSGTVTPSKPNVRFSPANRTYVNVQADQLKQDYTAIMLVTSLNDSGAGSLRQAIADSLSGGTIQFDSALAGKTITLVSQLDVNKNLTIDGTGLNPPVIISGNHLVRIMSIGSSCTVSLQSLVMKDGTMSGTSYTMFGGAIYTNNYTNLTAANVAFNGNSAYKAGAIYIAPYAVVNISNSEFTGNKSDQEAGAIFVQSIGILNLKNSTISDTTSATGAIYFTGATNTSTVDGNLFANNSALSGGAISGDLGNARLEIRNNLFSGNQATGPYNTGGALALTAHTIPTLVILENNTFYNNTATALGGGAYLEAAADYYLINNTFSNNMAVTGGNLYLAAGASVPKMYNNILANSAGGGDCYAFYNSFVSGSNNIIEDGSPNCGATLTADPKLGPLANNGGPTQTMALLADSPAIDAGNDGSCTTTDQRGVTRPQGSHCDIGAYEAELLTVTADPKAITYGDPDPAFTFQYSGFLGGDTSGVIDVSPTCGVSGAHANAGSYPIKCSGGADNRYAFVYVDSTLTINKADPTLSVTNSPVTYNGSPYYAAVMGAVAGSISNISMGGAASQTNAGTYPVTANFTPTDTTNYNSLTDASAGNFVIDKVTPTLSVTNSPVTYNGTPHAALVTGSVSGIASNISMGGAASQTNAGTYAVTANFTPTDTTNYNTLTDASAGNFVIDKATPTLSVMNSPVIYDGTPHAALVTGSVSGTVSNILTGGASTKTNAGTYAVTANFIPTDTTNYIALTNASAGNFVINKATPTLSVTNSPVTYDGSSHAASVTSSVTGSISNILTGGSAWQTNTGMYPVTANFTPIDTTNYTSLIDASAGDFVINKATPTLSVTNSPTAYDGTPHFAAVMGSVAGSTSNILMDGAASQTNAGTYAVTANFTPTDTTNYTILTNASAGDFVINKTTPILSVTNSPVTYNGSSRSATVTGSVTGTVSNILTGNAASQTNAGTYPVTANFTPTDITNYNSLTNASAGNFVINKATPILSVTNSPVAYDGAPHAALVASSVSGTVSNILTGGAATQTDLGTYAVTADFTPSDTANYSTLVNASAGNLVITDVPLVVSVTRAGANPTDAGSVSFTVVFSEIVTGVDLSDFSLTTSGISGASITDVSGSGSVYTVTVNTGSGAGTIRLDVVDDDSIKDVENNPLGGAGAANGNFTDGEVYIISANIQVYIGGSEVSGSPYVVPSGEEKRLTYPLSDGPVVVHSTNAVNLASAIRLQSYGNNTLYSFVETMGRTSTISRPTTTAGDR